MRPLSCIMKSKGNVLSGSFSCEDGPGQHEYCVLQLDSDYFQCGDGTCVCRASRCDGNHDCEDGSDEADMDCGIYIVNGK